MSGDLHSHSTKAQKLQSSRMVLRKPTVLDVPALFAIFGDPATNTFNPAGPYESVAVAESAMERSLAHWDNEGFGQWAISLKEMPDVVIGFGGLAYRLFGTIRRPNLGYRFAPSAWGRGLATELAACARDFGFSALGFDAIWASVRENHIASRRVLEKIGMQRAERVADERGFPASIVYVMQNQ